MNCHDALAALLDAAPAELNGLGESEITIHLRGCHRCARVAALLSVGGEQVLRAVAETPRVAAVPRRAPRLVLAGVALAALALVVPGRREDAPPAGESIPRLAVAVADAVAAEAEESPVVVQVEQPVATPTATTAVPESVQPQPIVPVPVRAIAFVPESAVVPDVMSPPSSPPSPLPAATFAVRPPVGSRAEVRRTADETITIILLHPEPSRYPE